MPVEWTASGTINSTGGALLTEDTDIYETEDGDPLIQE